MQQNKYFSLNKSCTQLPILVSTTSIIWKVDQCLAGQGGESGESLSVALPLDD
jgi:hypothetical protein